jgi:class 3 adenylate cyclase
MSSVGSYGSEGRMTYTAIGLQTNIAGRIQSKCEPGSILMSDATYQLIDDVIDCVPKGEIECKGVHYPVKVYAPV